MKDKTFVALSSVFFLLFLVGMSIVALEKPAKYILRAKTQYPSPLKSFIAVFPQIGKAGDELAGETPTKIKVLVNIRDVNGRGLSDRKVKLTTNPSDVEIIPSDTQITDSIGQAQFYLTSKFTQIVEITAIDTESKTKVANTPTVEFQ